MRVAPKQSASRFSARFINCTLILSHGHDAGVQSWPTGERRRVDVQVLHYHFRRRVSKPIRQGNLFEFGRPKDSEKLQVRVAVVLHIMSVVAWGVANIPGTEVHRAHVWAGIEHAHARLALNVVLPLIGIGMPMHLPYAAGPDRLERRGNSGGNFESCAIDDLQRAASRTVPRRERT
jgi:hypothetical protein